MDLTHEVKSLGGIQTGSSPPAQRESAQRLGGAWMR